ncbi:hypothetical protein PS918_03510 [Pseudomonas fluorescens]|uniref:Uncharacterized protein n=1 Tax=Pseudomonas fluorescens TaxID=294 RepID=A0A5E7T551_PSEFL|nr:hypothetical protein [Pseudomonas fluorescens]VVP93866.1 hypothetical protein PS918_03510 [Pseudomonas fluorescens]
MTLKDLFIYWPLLSIAIVAVLCRLVHNAKAAVRALEIQMTDTKVGDSASRREPDKDRRVV